MQGCFQLRHAWYFEEAPPQSSIKIHMASNSAPSKPASIALPSWQLFILLSLEGTPGRPHLVPNGNVV